MSSCIFGYSVTDSNGIVTSAAIKINEKMDYVSKPAFLVADGTSAVKLFNFGTGALTTAYTITGRTVNELATNQNDALLYFYESATNIIYAYDPVVSPAVTFTLASSVVVSSTNTVRCLGFDNVRNYLYVGYNSGSIISRIAVYPYDRYGATSGSQRFFASSMTITNAGTALTGTVNEITVDPSTGILFVALQNGATCVIYKINPVTGATVDTSKTVSSSLVLTTFASDDNLYIVDATNKKAYRYDPIIWQILAPKLMQHLLYLI